MAYDRNIKEFIKTYPKEILDSNAAIFAGAGLSRPAGYVDWKELLREIAEDIGLDIDQETDLISLAQYHVNESGRGKVNQILIEEFTKDVRKSENHEILSRLPISTYWTTNYDRLIESNLESVGKKVDAKIVPENMTVSVPGCDAIVYKMHGDRSLPHEAVLTKDDFEGYDLNRKTYSTALQGDLVSKTFLFLGFSFDDPNLSQILSKIRNLLDQNQRTHYCFMKKVNQDDFNQDEAKFAYAEIKQELKIKDLKRYGIKVLLVDDYSDITNLLKQLELLVKRKNIFISGSAHEYGDWEEKQAMEFTTKLSKAVIRSNNNVVSGFGLGIGSCIISGALEELYSNNTKNIDGRLRCRPFPQTTTGDISRDNLWTKYRDEMLSQVGVSIFIFGNKLDKDEVVAASGMEEEFSLSIKNGSIPIPIGATGYTAKALWDQVMANFSEYVKDETLRPLYESLGDDKKTPEELIDTVEKIIKSLVRHG